MNVETLFYGALDKISCHPWNNIPKAKKPIEKRFEEHVQQYFFVGCNIETKNRIVPLYKLFTLTSGAC